MLLGPALGIATTLWPQALLLTGLGILLMVSPPRRSPGVIWLSILTLIGTLSLTAFMPARWVGIPEWRRTLTAEYPVELPDTLSPQPWLSCHAVILLFAGLICAAYLLAQPWRSEARRNVMRIYVTGVTLLAIVAIVSVAWKYRLPFLPKVSNSALGFGFFPNRNQTANVLALAGILATALTFESVSERNKHWWWWLLSVLILGVAAVMAYSRAGILLFFGGIATWVLVSTGLSSSRKGAAIGVAGIAIALTLFFVFGGETFERFQRGAQAARTDFRVSIQSDAMKLSATAPLFGQGIGNFDPVFAMARKTSIEQNRARHPESDWLWVAVEMGWPVVLLMLAALILCLKQSFPFSRGSDRPFRSASAVCAAAFAAHSFGDVSGHRPGAVWPALLMMALALHPDRKLEIRRWVAPVFRIAGLLLAVVGVWWLASIRADVFPKSVPNQATIVRLSEQVDREFAAGEFKEIIPHINELLRLTPLDYELYFRRGVARVAEAFSVWGAARDFLTARHLQPNLATLCVEEGRVWFAAGQLDLGLNAWIEALRRAGDRAPVIYERMLGESYSKFSMHNTLRRIARMNPDLFVVFLRHADRIECDLEIGTLLDEEPTLEPLTHSQRKKLFSAWFHRGDRSLLIARMLAEPAWQEDGWPYLARAFAEQKDFERAYRLAMKFATVPALPQPVLGKQIIELERAFQARPDDVSVGIDLYSTQRAAGKTDEALATLTALGKLPRRPGYLAFLEAQFMAELEDWEKAWNAWWKFAGANYP